MGDLSSIPGCSSIRRDVNLSNAMCTSKGNASDLNHLPSQILIPPCGSRNSSALPVWNTAPNWIFDACPPSEAPSISSPVSHVSTPSMKRLPWRPLNKAMVRFNRRAFFSLRWYWPPERWSSQVGRGRGLFLEADVLHSTPRHIIYYPQ